MDQTFQDVIIESLIILILVAPLVASILLGIFVSWWFLFINAIYLIIIPLIIIFASSLVRIYLDEK